MILYTLASRFMMYDILYMIIVALLAIICSLVSYYQYQSIAIDYHAAPVAALSRPGGIDRRALAWCSAWRAGNWISQ